MVVLTAARLRTDGASLIACRRLYRLLRASVMARRDMPTRSSAFCFHFRIKKVQFHLNELKKFNSALMF